MSEYLRVMVGVSTVLIASAAAYALAHHARKGWTPCTVKQIEGPAILLGLLLPLVLLLLAQVLAIGRLGIANDEPGFGGVAFFLVAMACYNLTRRAVWALFANKHAQQWLRIDGPGRLSLRTQDGTEHSVAFVGSSVARVPVTGALPYIAYSFEHQAQRYAFVVGMEKLKTRPPSGTPYVAPPGLFVRGIQKELEALFDVAARPAAP